MRIHLTLTLDEQIAVVNEASKAAGVYLDRYTWHGSHSHARAIDVILSGESGRRTNQRWGWREEGTEAATWDQWGIFLAVIFDADPTARCDYYADADDFHEKTGYRFYRGVGADENENTVLSQQSPDYKITPHRWSYNMATRALTCKGHSTAKNKRAECHAVRGAW